MNKEEIEHEDIIELEKLNSEIQNMDYSKHCIEIEIDKLGQYIKSGSGNLIFVKYLDVNEFREIEIKDKSQAQANINEMNQLIQNINQVLLVKEKRASELRQEIYSITSLKSSEKNKLREEIKRTFDENINVEKEDKYNYKTGLLDVKYASKEEKCVWYRPNMRISLSNIISTMLTDYIFEKYIEFRNDRPLHRHKCLDDVKVELRRLLTKDIITNESEITHDEYIDLIESFNKVYDNGMKEYLEYLNQSFVQENVKETNESDYSTFKKTTPIKLIPAITDDMKILLPLKEKFEKLVHNHGELTFYGIIKLSDIYESKSELRIYASVFQDVKLKDLVDKKTGENILDDKKINNIKEEYEIYKSIVYRLHQITQEIHKIEYGMYSELPLIPIKFSLKEFEKKHFIQPPKIENASIDKSKSVINITLQNLNKSVNIDNEIKNVSDSDLRSREQELEKIINESDEKIYKGLVKLKEVHEKDGILYLLQFSDKPFIALNELTELNSENKLFSDKSLEYFTKEYNDCEELKYRLHKIKEELHYRTYGHTIPYPPHQRDLERLKPIFKIISDNSPSKKPDYNFLDELFEYRTFQNEFKSSEEVQSKSNTSDKEIKSKVPINNEDNVKVKTQREKIFEFVKDKDLKAIVFDVLKKPDNKIIVIEKIPAKERKQNKKWKLSTEQVYIKYFIKDYKKQKETIMRYIKSFRSENSNKK
jgi:hypothetical protein